MCPFPGQTLRHLPRGAVGEALACFWEPVGRPQHFPSLRVPRCAHAQACSPMVNCYFSSFTFEGFSLLSAGHFYVGHCIPSFLCRGGPDCPVPSQVHPSDGSVSQAPSGQPSSALVSRHAAGFGEPKGELPVRTGGQHRATWKGSDCPVSMAALSTSTCWGPPNHTASDADFPVSSQKPVTSPIPSGTNQPSDSELGNLERKQGWERVRGWNR